MSEDDFSNEVKSQNSGNSVNSPNNSNDRKLKERSSSPSSVIVTTTENSKLFDFKIFLKQLRDPRAEPIVKYTKSFIQNFYNSRRNYTCAEQVKLVCDFQSFIYEKFLIYEPFKSMNDLTNAKEGLEKLIMNKLYPKLFPPLATAVDAFVDVNLDEKFELQRLNYGKIVTPEMLEISNYDELGTHYNILDKFVKLATIELNKINNYRAPRDKMVCILNCCKVIYGILKKFQKISTADDFVPLLIYTLLKSDVKNLCSNCNYIECYRSKSFSTGESQYYLSSLQGAIKFILDMDKGSLRIKDEQQFDELYTKNQKLIEEERRTLLPLETATNTTIQNQPNSVANSGTFHLPNTDSVKAIFQNFLFPAENIRQEESHAIASDNHSDEYNDHTNWQVALLELGHKEHKETIKNLQSMFPEIEVDIIEDICIAKNYNTGQVVDLLLDLYN
ncbi:guanine nucleotide exchange factor VPS9 SCDLUD_001298 [Saccharomycodes ludwigii]|uniref:guanine nucleotide exchange factor VPS9 n=1 Tax=Saccharomycodes ludwigii TaxID=36035 RepID=UPI001E88AB42|nr:hypothetical protein SCDLUD_001298 [Saccharomycodes ludwigii]KAH3903650.1 hypothetical protein SCDLUD_001298 [Saccharomycodes ludwigii]